MKVDVKLAKIDATNAAKFEEILKQAEDEKITLNFENVLYISSIGLRSLMKATKAGKKISIINANQSVSEIFKLTGLDKVYIK